MMKDGKWLCMLLAGFILAGVFAAGCVVNPPKGPVDEAQAPVEIINPQEYFPMTGVWYYKVDLRETTPLLYWSSRTNILRASLLRERDFQVLKKINPHNLIIKVQSYEDFGGGEKQSELRIVEDELGLLMNTPILSWKMSSEQGVISVSQRTYYDNQVSIRPLFAMIAYSSDRKLQSRITSKGSISENEDVLMYQGMDSGAPGCGDRACMKFTRTITKGSGKYGYTDNGFIETTYFAKGKGLVYLIQEVELDGGMKKVSMTWTLEQYKSN